LTKEQYNAIREILEEIVEVRRRRLVISVQAGDSLDGQLLIKLDLLAAQLQLAQHFATKPS
jgi:hypothetical protein